MFLFVKNFFLFPCYLQGEPLWGNSPQQILGWDVSVSWLLPDIKVLVIFQFFDILRKVKHPKHAAETAYHNVNLLFEDHPQFGCNCSSIIPPLLIIESLSNKHFFTTEVSIPWEEWIENGICGAKIFNLSVCSFFTTDAYSVELLSALKQKTGKAVGNVFG